MLTAATHAAVVFVLLLRVSGESQCIPAPDSGSALVQSGLRALSASKRSPKPSCESLPFSGCEGEAPNLCRWNAWRGRCQASIAWFHPMKCGSTFGATLVHFANSSLPEGAHMPSCGFVDNSDEDLCNGGEQGPLEFFTNKYPLETWFGDMFWTAGERSGDPGNHRPISDESFSSWSGHFVGLFREPAHRAASAFNHFMGGKGNITEFADFSKGLVTKLLAGDQGYTPVHCEFLYRDHFVNWTRDCTSDYCQQCIRSAEDDLPKALQRLKGFAFVGLIEHFDLSVCLFHAMFGGKCFPVEFVNMRKGVEHQDPAQLASTISSHEDPYDRAVYNAATEIFWQNVARFDVNSATCARICPDAAHVFERAL